MCGKEQEAWDITVAVTDEVTTLCGACLAAEVSGLVQCGACLAAEATGLVQGGACLAAEVTGLVWCLSGLHTAPGLINNTPQSWPR